MNKRYLFLFLFLFVIFFSLPPVKIKTVNFFNFLKLEIFSFSENLKNEILNLIHQEEKIKKLKIKNMQLKKKIAFYESFFENCKDLKKFKFIKDSNLTFTKAVSYVSIPDFSRIYIEYVGKTYPRGLVYNNLAAGIVVKRVGNYSLALLNTNKKVSYTVYILDGGKKITGIFKGGENIIEYIPRFAKIKKGDLVITNGLDGLFYQGAKVGVIESVKKENLYQKAKVNLFYKGNVPDYFYVVEKVNK